MKCFLQKSTNSASKPKVVRREVCQVTTPGTQTFSYMDTGVLSQEGPLDESRADSIGSGGFASQCHAKLLLALCERPMENERATYGICFVDVATAKFQMGQFDDDFQRSGLRTLLAHYPPVQLLFERGRVSPETQTVFRTSLAGQVLKEGLSPKTQFWEAKRTLRELSSPEYFGSRLCDEGEIRETWPEGLLNFLEKSDLTRQTPARTGELAIMALGAVIWYLRDCLMDVDLVSMKNFCAYSPQKQTGDRSEWWEKQKMVLDGITLRNLDVVPGDSTGEGECYRGTLLDRLDYCSTAFGKRLLRQWLCAPLCDVAEIANRQAAIKELVSSHPVFVQKGTVQIKQNKI